MWEALLKLNPSFIRYVKNKDDDDFSVLMEFVLSQGYVPSFSDLKNNPSVLDYVEQNPDLIKRVVERDPKTLSLICNIDDKMIKACIANGYKPSIKDVKKSLLASIDFIMLELIKENPKNVVFYEGTDDKVIATALSLGWVPTKKDLLKNPNLKSNNAVMRIMIDKDPRNIVLYDGENQKLIEYAVQKGYKPRFSDIKKDNALSYDLNIMRNFVRKNPRNIIFYNGGDVTLIKEALDLGYVPNIGDVKETMLSSSRLIMERLVEQDPKNILFYTGGNTELIKKAIDLGFRPQADDFNDYWHLFNDESVFRTLIQKDFNYITFCPIRSNSLILEAIKLGYIPKVSDVKNSYGLRSSDIILKKLLEQDPRNVIYYIGNNSEIIDMALERGFIPTLDDVKKSKYLASNDKIMKEIILHDSNAIIYYKGTTPEIFNLAVDLGYIPVESDILNNNSHLCYSDRIMKIMVEKDCKFVRFYKGENQDIIELALKMGYIPTKVDLKNNKLLARNKTITEMLLREDISNLNLFKSLGDDAMVQALTAFKEIYGVNIPEHYSDMFKVYKGDLSFFCLAYERFSSFLMSVGMDEKVFLQYAFSNSQDWLKDITRISTCGKLDEFKMVKDYFFTNYYFNTSKQKGVVEVNSFLNIIKNYLKFPDLCRDIVNQNRPLTEEERTNLNMIFMFSTVFNEENKPKSINDLNNVIFNLKEFYCDKLNQKGRNSIDIMRNDLCQLLFNVSEVELRSRLDIFGDTQVLRQLLFNNRKNPEIEPYIRKMMLYTSLIEDVLSTNNPQCLREIINNAFDNFDNVIKFSLKFSSYEEDMRHLYEMDIQGNLTRFNNIKNPASVIDAEKTAKYGVDVLDFSDKKYCLLTHVMSKRESPEELIRGKAEKNKNFICISSISNRNQVYYTNPGENKIIFATDMLPNGTFLQSSVTNMGSNSRISYNDGNVVELDRTQRGIVETSHAPKGNNSEILAFREDVKFNYIVLPGGREPTEREIELAKKFELKFIVTQGVREMVEEPNDIEMIDDNHTVEIEKINNSIQQSGSRKFFFNDEEKRSVAILTDAHGLFEPTLAILEDARKRGITEIYSLGDNIGTGPNPCEVMDLLDEYGVISLVGNHELYVLMGVDAFKEHLDKAGPRAYFEAQKNSSWTASQLTDQQKKALRLCDKMIELTLGDKRILLCHDVKDFNTDKVVVDTSVYDEVFRGHIHFSKNEGNITTIPGVGIGSNAGKATYMILTEKENGGYDREIVTVSYDKTNMRYGIIESSMSNEDKAKIERWAGVSDETRRR